MEKINFNQVRGFSDSITLTFNFIKQEFKPLLRSFAVIALPVIFIGLFFMSYSARESLIAIVQPDQYAGSPLDMLTNSLLTNLSTMVIYFWMALIGIAYIRVYQDKVAAADEARITPGEVWQEMWRNLGKSLLWAVIYLLMVVFGTILFIAPGVYLGVVFGFVFYYMILENRSISAGMSGSRELLKGKWWNFFGYVIVLQLIVGGLSYIFSIPYLVLTFKTTFTQQLPGIYETTFSLLFANLGQSLLQLISVVGIAVRFFTYLEQKEHTGLLSKIGQIGNRDKQMPEREEMH